MSIVTAFEAACDICTNGGSCDDLHIMYLIGSILTIFGCSFVISTYMWSAPLRQHPAVLIFSRCIFDLLFGICFFIQYFLDKAKLACNESHCAVLGAIILFCFLCSQGYFAASIRDLYSSLKNPFSQPHKDVTKIHIGIMLIALIVTLFVSFHYSFSYRVDLQFCSIKPSATDINPYNLVLIYIPISALIITSVSVNIYAVRRLTKGGGLEDTFAIRITAIKDSLFYCLGYMFYFLVLGVCYFLGLLYIYKYIST